MNTHTHTHTHTHIQPIEKDKISWVNWENEDIGRGLKEKGKAGEKNREKCGAQQKLKKERKKQSLEKLT